MQIFALITEFNTILDALALASSLMMILFLIRNRRKYGRMLLDERDIKGGKVFASEFSQQMISQQTQKAYDSLQRSLTKEFEALQRIGGGCRPATVSNQKDTTNKGLNFTASEAPLESHHNRFRLADKMIAKGTAVDQILQRCGLAEGELELLQGLRELEQRTSS